MRHKKPLYFLIAAIVGLALSACIPASGGLTESGVKMLAVFVATTILWFGVSDRLSVFCFSLLGVVGIVGMPYKDALTTSVLNDSTVICFLALLLAESLNSTGAMEYISKWLLSREIVKGHPYVFILFIMVTGIILGTLTAIGMSVVFIFAFAMQLLKFAKIGPDNPVFCGTMVGILWCYGFSEMTIPYKCVSAQFVMGVGAGLGYPVTDMQLMSMGFPLLFFCLAMGMVVIRLFFNPTKADFSNYEVDTMRDELLKNPLTPAAKAALGGTVLCFVLLLTQSLTFIPFVKTFFAPVGPLVCYWIPLVLLSLVSFDGKPVLDVSGSLKRVSWDMVFFMANIMLFATTIAKPEFGITTCVRSLIEQAVGNVPSLVLFAMAIIFTGVLTNISSNYATVSLSCSVFVPLLADMGLSPQLAVVAIGQIAFCAFVTPAAGLGPAVIFSSGEVSMRKLLAPNLVMLMLYVVAITALGYALAL